MWGFGTPALQTIMSRRFAFTTIAALLAGIILVIAAEHPAVLRKKHAVKPRKTHAEIAERQKPSPDPAERQEVRREDVMKVTHRNERAKKGLMSRSSTLSSPYAWTIVPKGAILHVPTLYEKRVNDVRNGKLVGWHEFYGQNRNWVRAVPVTIAQARGDDPLSDEFLKSLQVGGQLLVAVCSGGPISVMFPPDEGSGQEEPGKEPEGAKSTPADEAKALENLKRRLNRRAN